MYKYIYYFKYTCYAKYSQTKSTRITQYLAVAYSVCGISVENQKELYVKKENLIKLCRNKLKEDSRAPWDSTCLDKQQKKGNIFRKLLKY